MSRTKFRRFRAKESRHSQNGFTYSLMGINPSIVSSTQSGNLLCESGRNVCFVTVLLALPAAECVDTRSISRNGLCAL